MGYTSPTTEAACAYDALDRRIAKTVDGVVTAYVYDMSPYEPLAYDDITLEFTDGILARRWAHSDAVDEPLGFEGYVAQSGVGSGAEHAIYADRQGSVIWVTDPATGAVVAGYEYDAYGQITQTTGTLVQPYGYTGREYDAESGLYHYRARAFDATSGVFLQGDPLGFMGGTANLYSYGWSNPVKFADPSGLTSSVSCAQGIRSGGACGSMAGLVNPVFNGIGNLAMGLAAVITASNILGPGTEITDDNRDRIPFPPPVCNMVGANYPSTAGPGQSVVPPTLFAQMVWVSILLNPGMGRDFTGMNNDPRFCGDNGWQKKEVVATSASGEKITFHYQFNSVLGTFGKSCRHKNRLL